MITTLLSFLGGTAFRMLWGEISAWLTARQQHAQEMDRMRLQGDLEAAQHARNMESIKVQAGLAVQTIRVQAEGAIGQIEATAWGDAAAGVTKLTGIWLVDLWNGIIRPLTASICLFLWVRHVATSGWVLDEQGWAILGAALGLYLADRALAKRGK
jgi:hypothetical protein